MNEIESYSISIYYLDAERDWIPFIIHWVPLLHDHCLDFVIRREKFLMEYENIFKNFILCYSIPRETINISSKL